VAEAVPTTDNNRPLTERNNSFHVGRSPHQQRAETVAAEMRYCQLRSIHQSVNQSNHPTHETINITHENRKCTMVRISRVPKKTLCNQKQQVMILQQQQ